MSVYQVTGRLAYRGHQPGAVFETVLDPQVEARAVARRNIRIIERSDPNLQPGSYTLPRGWANSKKEGSTDG